MPLPAHAPEPPLLACGRRKGLLGYDMCTCFPLWSACCLQGEPAQPSAEWPAPPIPQRHGPFSIFRKVHSGDKLH